MLTAERSSAAIRNTCQSDAYCRRQHLAVRQHGQRPPAPSRRRRAFVTTRALPRPPGRAPPVPQSTPIDRNAQHARPPPPRPAARDRRHRADPRPHRPRRRAAAELEASIAASGLRQPIEVFPLEAPRGDARYGLLSGFRRLHAFRTLHETTRQDRYATIPAFLRDRTSLASALAAMVEENEIRAGLSPFERGLVAVTARNQGAYPSIEGPSTGSIPPPAARSGNACAPSPSSPRKWTASSPPPRN